MFLFFLPDFMKKFSLKKYISYLYPLFTIKKSRHNGLLRVGYMDGKKVINTKNANYSFGSLHRIMTFALGEIAYTGKDDILLLWLGGGSAIAILRDDFHLENSIVAVDFDPDIIRIAREDFWLDVYPNVTIEYQDASEYIKKIDHVFGLVIVDLFIDNRVPQNFFEPVFWENLVQHTHARNIIFNVITKTTDPDTLRNVIGVLQEMNFFVTVHHGVSTTNTEVLAKLQPSKRAG